MKHACIPPNLPAGKVAREPRYTGHCMPPATARKHLTPLRPLSCRPFSAYYALQEPSMYLYTDQRDAPRPTVTAGGSVVSHEDW